MATSQLFFLEPEVSGINGLSGSSRSQRQIELEQSYCRSHAARISHRIRKETSPLIQRKSRRRQYYAKEQDRDRGPPNTNPSWGYFGGMRYVAFYPGDTASEARSLTFFRERTAVEWSGWQDADFWIKVISQVSFVSSALRHALIGLAACHESYESSNHDRKESLQQMSIIHGQKALRCLNQQYATLSSSAILATYIGISAFAARLHPGAHAYIMTLQYEFYEQLKTSQSGSLDEVYMRCYLEPIIERQSSRSAHFLDLSWNLARTPAQYFKSTESISIPKHFSDLKHARDTLEAVLHFVTYEVKVKGYSIQKFPPATALLLRQWYEALQIYRDTKACSVESKQALDVLRAYARINVIMIQTMNTKTETVFDEYLDAYSELADTFEQLVQLEKKSQRMAINFGADGCLITLIGNTAARWCREPSIRRKLIRLLYECKRAEGFETAETWAMVASKIQELEETGIFPSPTSCHQIPAESRLRMVRALFYFEPSLLRIHFVRPSQQNDEVEEICLLQDRRNMAHLAETYPFAEREFALQPDLDVGKDYFSWLDKQTRTYHTMRGSNFYFPLPRC